MAEAAFRSDSPVEEARAQLENFLAVDWTNEPQHAPAWNGALPWALAYGPAVCRDSRKESGVRRVRQGMVFFSSKLAADTALAVMEALPSVGIYDTLRRCRRCGCTDANACVGAGGDVCHWAEPDLCSSCAGAR